MTVTEHVRELDRRLTAGAPFGAIEDWLEQLRAPEGVKDALWLLAWSEQEQTTRRRLVCEALTTLAHPSG